MPCERSLLEIITSSPKTKSYMEDVRTVLITCLQTVSLPSFENSQGSRVRKSSGFCKLYHEYVHLERNNNNRFPRADNDKARAANESSALKLNIIVI